MIAAPHRISGIVRPETARGLAIDVPALQVPVPQARRADRQGADPSRLAVGDVVVLRPLQPLAVGEGELALVQSCQTARVVI